MKKSYGVDGAMETIKRNLPTWLEHTSEIPQLIHELLSLKTRPLTKLQQIEQAKALKIQQQRENKKTYAILASGFGIVTAILFGLDVNSDKYWGLTIPVIVSLSVTLLFLFKTSKRP